MAQVIPEDAVEAGMAAHLLGHDSHEAAIRAILEASAPHILKDISKARKGDLFRFTWAQRAWLRHNPYRPTP